MGKSLKFQPCQTAINYAIELERKEFLAIVQLESLKNIGRVPESYATLFDRLDRMDGVSHVEYDGHFGPNLFVTIAVEQDHARVLKKIQRLYAACVKSAQKNLAEIDKKCGSTMMRGISGGKEHA